MKKYFMRFLDTDFSDNVSGVLKTAVVCLCLSLIVAQTGLKISCVRSIFTGSDPVGDAVTAGGEAIVQKGSATITMTSGTPHKEISILINGDEYALFDKTEIQLEISNQSVIEVVNNSGKDISVVVRNISDNLYAAFDNGDTKVENIAVICRLLFR